MLRSLVCAAFALVVCAVAVLAGETRGKVKSVDPDKNTITVTVDDKDVTFKVTDDTKILRKGKDGDKEVKDGLKNEKAWKRGPNVIVTTDGDGTKGKVKEIRIVGGKRKKKDQ
jgi:hypothetical protein